MSEYEHNKGKLTPTGKTVEEYCKDINLGNNSVEDYFNEYLYGDALSINGQVFEISSEYLDPYDDIAIASTNDDGSYNFEVKFYNGGASEVEVIEEALNKIGVKVD